ncbi:uncharacterized protein G2W53_008767 [Senna tora]|uniref:Uncharacterized protein n=1 Tax=Senna tora TaxID=362788 RepID=A0A834WXS8_9FABA|nr:uncharacterized protein G2W53_008767 [Senna tora]
MAFSLDGHAIIAQLIFKSGEEVASIA